MPFIGNQPALSYTSFAKQDFSTSATTTYTLDNPVTNANELALFINFVRQKPTTAYSASGTTLTLTSATSATDDMYCVYLGKAVQTVNPPNASVGASQIVDASITSGKLASGVLPDNTPAFFARLSSNQTLSDSTNTKATLDTKDIDTDSAFDNTTNYRFTVPSGKAGKYVIYYGAYFFGTGGIDRTWTRLNLNGSSIQVNYFDLSSGDLRTSNPNTAILDLSVGDYLELFLTLDGLGGTLQAAADGKSTYLGGYKLIGV